MLRQNLNFRVCILSAVLVANVLHTAVQGTVITIHAGDDRTTKSSSEIIGSSVVTSVSVVLGDGLTNPGDQTTESFSPSNNAQSKMTSAGSPPVLLTINSVPIPDPTIATAEFATNNFIRSLSNSDNNRPLPHFQTSSPSSQLIIRNKAQRKDENGGVQNVIQTLKTIVQEEQQKHDGTSPRPTTANSVSVQPVDETPPTIVVTTQQNQNKFVPGSSLSGEDDDEMESTGGTNPSDPGPHTTDAIDDFAKHVVSISAMPEEQESDNDTATSSEVHDAIHKISGAILSVEGGGDDKGNKKPIENIVTDVLSSINTARNSSSGDVTGPASDPLPASTRPTTTTTPTTTTRATPKTTTTKKVSTTKKAAASTASSKKATKPLTTTTKKPPRTSTPAQPQNQNKLKTELGDSNDNVNVKKQPETRPHPSPSPHPHKKVQLPMIIMLDNDRPLPPRNKKPEMMDKEQEMPQTKYRLPGIPSDNDNDPFDTASDDAGPYGDTGNAWLPSPNAEIAQHDEADAEVEEGENHQAQIPIEYTTLRPYVPPPTKASNKDQYWQAKRPGNSSSSNTRPNEFYDDEIFGYDPYQTFFHGVYVPVVEVGTLTEIQNEQDANASDEDDFGFRHPSSPRRTTPRPRRPVASVGGSRPVTKQGKPGATKGKKPMPALPDHLHRPRPSHLQYQHGAADDTDPETGLLNAHYQHAGHGYNPDRANPAEQEFISPDKLSLQSRPALPTQVRKNFTDHHDHHIQHQHGIGGAGHGGHGGGHGHGGHGHDHDHLHSHLAELAASEKRPNFDPAPKGNPGLEATLTSLDEEKRLFVDINNRLAHRLLSALTNPVSHSTTQYGSMVVSPFTIISSLGMLFLGSRGQTAAQIDGLLQIDDMLRFNPHMMYHNVTEAFLSQPNTAAAIIRLLVTDKDKGDVLEFYKTRVQHFYEARVEEVDYKFAGHLAQSIINQMIRAQIQRHSYEMLNYSLPLLGPMSLLTAAFFDGQFAGARDPSVDSMNFIHLAALTQNQNQHHQGPSARRLFQVPAFALKGRFRAVFDKELDATAVELPYTSRDLSLILVMPGKPGEFAFGGVTSLKSRLNLDAWTKLMRGFYARDTFKVIVPRFRHQSGVNLSHTLSRFGLTDMFEPTLAKFKGINGLADLYLDKNMMHFSEFGTWEKLSDTLTENNNRNLDLIRILRPHVREHYGNYGEPMSVNEWFKNKNKEDPQQRSQTDQYQNYADYANSHPTIIPDDVSRLRMELERLKRRHPVQSQSQPEAATMSSSPQDRSWYQNNNQQSNPLSSYAKVRGSTVEFRPRTLRAGIRTQRSNSKTYYFRQRQEEIDTASSSTPPEQETVLRFERPFIYVLRHNPTGMILMTGQYTEPLTEVLE